MPRTTARGENIDRREMGDGTLAIIPSLNIGTSQLVVAYAGAIGLGLSSPLAIQGSQR